MKSESRESTEGEVEEASHYNESWIKKDDSSDDIDDEEETEDKLINYADADEIYYRPSPLESSTIRVNINMFPQTSFDMIQPKVDHYHYNFHMKNIAKNSYVEVPRFEQVFRNYSQFKDPEYNRTYHQIVNGLLEEYMRIVNEISTQIESRPVKQSKLHKLRCNVIFVNQRIPKIQVGLSQFSDFPVSILNEKALLKMVDGIEYCEHARFIHLISNCKKFCVDAKQDKKNEFYIQTSFDGSRIFRFLFGREEGLI